MTLTVPAPSYADWLDNPFVPYATDWAYVRKDGDRLDLSLRSLIQLKAESMDLTYEDIVGPIRARAVSWPRQQIMFDIKKARPEFSLHQIGRVMSRDHRTVIHGIRAAAIRNGFEVISMNGEMELRKL